jgi:hypothetical protein
VAAVFCVTSDSILPDVHAPTMDIPAIKTAALAKRNCRVSFCSRQKAPIEAIMPGIAIAFCSFAA